MTKGQIVKIYQKPISKENFEGKAKLIKKISSHARNTIQRWKVQFVGYEEDGTFERNISV